MLNKNDFALEKLEDRLETICIYIPYIGVCSRKILWITIYYPCVKYRIFCF